MAVGPVYGDFDMTLVLGGKKEGKKGGGKATFPAVLGPMPARTHAAPCDVHFPQHTALFVAC